MVDGSDSYIFRKLVKQIQMCWYAYKSRSNSLMYRAQRMNVPRPNLLFCCAQTTTCVCCNTRNLAGNCISYVKIRQQYQQLNNEFQGYITVAYYSSPKTENEPYNNAYS